MISVKDYMPEWSDTYFLTDELALYNVAAPYVLINNEINGGSVTDTCEIEGEIEYFKVKTRTYLNNVEIILIELTDVRLDNT